MQTFVSCGLHNLVAFEEQNMSQLQTIDKTEKKISKFWKKRSRSETHNWSFVGSRSREIKEKMIFEIIEYLYLYKNREGSLLSFLAYFC